MSSAACERAKQGRFSSGKRCSSVPRSTATCDTPDCADDSLCDIRVSERQFASSATGIDRSLAPLSASDQPRGRTAASSRASFTSSTWSDSLRLTGRRLCDKLRAVRSVGRRGSDLPHVQRAAASGPISASTVSLPAVDGGAAGNVEADRPSGVTGRNGGSGFWRPARRFGKVAARSAVGKPVVRFAKTCRRDVPKPYLYARDKWRSLSPSRRPPRGASLDHRTSPDPTDHVSVNTENTRIAKAECTQAKQAPNPQTTESHWKAEETIDGSEPAVILHSPQLEAVVSVHSTESPRATPSIVNTAPLHSASVEHTVSVEPLAAEIRRDCSTNVASSSLTTACASPTSVTLDVCELDSPPRVLRPRKNNLEPCDLEKPCRTTGSNSGSSRNVPLRPPAPSRDSLTRAGWVSGCTAESQCASVQEVNREPYRSKIREYIEYKQTLSLKPVRAKKRRIQSREIACVRSESAERAASVRVVDIFATAERPERRRRRRQRRLQSQQICASDQPESGEFGRPTSRQPPDRPPPLSRPWPPKPPRCRGRVAHGGTCSLLNIDQLRCVDDSVSTEESADYLDYPARPPRSLPRRQRRQCSSDRASTSRLVLDVRGDGEITARVSTGPRPPRRHCRGPPVQDRYFNPTPGCADRRDSCDSVGPRSVHSLTTDGDELMILVRGVVGAAPTSTDDSSLGHPHSPHISTAAANDPVRNNGDNAAGGSTPRSVDCCNVARTAPVAAPTRRRTTDRRNRCQPSSPERQQSSASRSMRPRGVRQQSSASSNVPRYSPRPSRTPVTSGFTNPTAPQRQRFSSPRQSLDEASCSGSSLRTVINGTMTRNTGLTHTAAAATDTLTTDYVSTDDEFFSVQSGPHTLPVTTASGASLSLSPDAAAAAARLTPFVQRLSASEVDAAAANILSLTAGRIKVAELEVDRLFLRDGTRVHLISGNGGSGSGNGGGSGGSERGPDCAVDGTSVSDAYGPGGSRTLSSATTTPHGGGFAGGAGGNSGDRGQAVSELSHQQRFGGDCVHTTSAYHLPTTQSPAKSNTASMCVQNYADCPLSLTRSYLGTKSDVKRASLRHKTCRQLPPQDGGSCTVNSSVYQRSAAVCVSDSSAQSVCDVDGGCVRASVGRLSARADGKYDDIRDRLERILVPSEQNRVLTEAAVCRERGRKQLPRQSAQRSKLVRRNHSSGETHGAPTLASGDRGARERRSTVIFSRILSSFGKGLKKQVDGPVVQRPSDRRTVFVKWRSRSVDQRYRRSSQGNNTLFYVHIDSSLSSNVDEAVCSHSTTTPTTVRTAISVEPAHQSSTSEVDRVLGSVTGVGMARGRTPDEHRLVQSVPASAAACRCDQWPSDVTCDISRSPCHNYEIDGLADTDNYGVSRVGVMNDHSDDSVSNHGTTCADVVPLTLRSTDTQEDDGLGTSASEGDVSLPRNREAVHSSSPGLPGEPVIAPLSAVVGDEAIMQRTMLRKQFPAPSLCEDSDTASDTSSLYTAPHHSPGLRLPIKDQSVETRTNPMIRSTSPYAVSSGLSSHATSSDGCAAVSASPSAHTDSEANSSLVAMIGAQDDDTSTQQHIQQRVDRSVAADKAYLVAHEMMTSEHAFVEALCLLNEDLRSTLSQARGDSGGCVVTPTEMDQLLGALPQLQRFSTDLLSDLSARVRDWHQKPLIADVFVRKGPFLKLYSGYICGFSAQCQLLSELRARNAAFAAVVDEFERRPECRQLSVTHYMLKPVQRIPQYRLLLEDYARQLDSHAADRENAQAALDIVAGVARHINDKMKDDDEFRRLLQLQSRLRCTEIVKPGRTIVKQGQLDKLCRKGPQPRFVILMSDSLLLTRGEPVSEPTTSSSVSSSNAGVLQLDYMLPLAGMKVDVPACEETDEWQNEFSVVTTTRSFTLIASDGEERDCWVDSLTSTITQHVAKRSTFNAAQHSATQYSQDMIKLGHSAPVWVPDSRASMCQLCTAEFTVTWRRHHCRACGRVVCASCSSHKLPLAYLKHVAARVCNLCHDTLQCNTDNSNNNDDINCTHSGDDSVSVVDRGVDASSVVRSHSSISPARRHARKVPTRLEIEASGSGSVIRGYLQQRCRRQWKRRWFALRGRVLYVYRASHDVAAIDTLPVLGYHVQHVKHSVVAAQYEGVDSSLVFQLNHSNQPPMIFHADSERLAERWVNSLQSASVLT